MALDLEHIQYLHLQSPAQAGRPSYIAAASGLVLWQNQFYVVSDDELHMAVFPFAGGPGNLIRLLPGQLPLEAKERKKAKPDFEALALIESLNSLLAVPSGSKPNRCRGALFSQGQAHCIDFTNLYQFLETQIPDLNIEGCAVLGDEMVLFQRGNGASRQNAMIFLNFRVVESELQRNQRITERAFLRIRESDLGQLEGVPLSFTDVAAESRERIWFLAAAENTDSTYDDGEYAGAVLGCVNAEGHVLMSERLHSPAKPEGLALDLSRNIFYVVTDADEISEPSQLFRGQLPK